MESRRRVDRGLMWHGVALMGAMAAVTVGCNQPEPAATHDDVGVVRLSLTAPAGVSCIRLRFAGTREVVRDVAVTTEVSTRLDGLPTGLVNIAGAAYAGACGAGDPLWVSDPIAVTLRAGAPADFRLVFRKNGIALVSADFIDDVSCTAPIASWSEEFTAPALDPAWTVFEYTGPRHNGQTSPANHFSLTDASGALRYTVDPMTHAGAWHDYVPFFAAPFYWYDPGLSVERELGGSRWAVDVRAEYFVPNVVNAAHHEIAVHFDPPGTAGLHCAFGRFSNDDVGAGTSTTNNTFYAGCSNREVAVGDGHSEWAGLATTIVRFVRFQRAGETLSIRVSPDGTSWNDVLSVPVPEQFRCVPQRFLISGAAWFSPQGSYADYDYVRFSRQD